MADVVVTVNVDGVADEIVMLATGAEQVSPVGELLTAQEKLTWPVKPPDGVTVSVLVPLLPAVTVMPPPLVSPMLGAALTVIWTVVVAVIFPVAASAAVTVAV